jgi:hypothetical protein
MGFSGRWNSRCGRIETSMPRFLLYGLSIAALEEFLTQGVLRGSYFLWVFTLIPFGLFLVLAGYLRTAIHRRVAGWRAPLIYYGSAGAIGLAVEWFIIGLAPWRDTTSPPLLIALFHAGMFSFWGTVALGPHILLDQRPAAARIKRVFVSCFAVLMAVTYVLTFAAKAAGADHDLQFLATIGPVIVTFLTLNGTYVWYFRSCD